LLQEIDKVAKILKPIIREKKVKIVSHIDSDGLTSASIIIKMLLREGVNFELRVVKQLLEAEIKELQIRESDFLILTDLGSGQLGLLVEALNRTQVLVLDHHQPERLRHLNLFHLNPLLFGEEEISSSMICYLLAKAVNIKNTDLIDLAIVGAVGDEQDERWEFRGAAKKILREGELLGRLSVLKGLRLYGRSSRPIHKALEYSFDPLIPGISGSESGAVQFLSELGIAIKEGERWRKLKDLTLEEQRKLASAIILERLRSKHPEAEDIFGDVYILLGRPEEIQDAREFSTLINACGRTGNHDIGLRLCLGDPSAIDASWYVLDRYRKLIGDSIDWARERFIIAKHGVYLFGARRIPDTLIGTILSIALNSNLVDDRPIFGFAETENGKTKVSARTSRNLKRINLRDIITQAAKEMGAQGGGHQFAAGALIESGKEREFMELLEQILGEQDGKKEEGQGKEVV
jgi:RecJ-like exonuclease